MCNFSFLSSASLNEASRATGCPVANPRMDSSLGRITIPWVRANLRSAQAEQRISEDRAACMIASPWEEVLRD
jgi:hypothetical protein